MATKAKTVELVRETLVVPKPSDLRAKLAKKAEKLFGYTALKTHMHLAEELGKALVNLDIEPFSKETVEKYKKSKTHKRTKISRWGNEITTRTSWKRIPIESYERPVPEFVLNKAVQIREAVPEASLFIEELHTSKQTKRQRREYRPDPFLIARLGGEEHYIEVWDEPAFEGRMTHKATKKAATKAKK